MKAGTELDAQIAEKVFGLTVLRDETFGVVTHAEPNNPAAGWWTVSPYSTDISAAWEVVKKVRGWPFSKRVAFKRALQEQVSARLGVSAGIVVAPEEIILRVEPVDICLAALEATKEVPHAGPTGTGREG